MRERVLILHPGALGDIILTIPYLHTLYRRKIAISLYTQSWLIGLHNIFNFIDEWHSLESNSIYKLFGSDFNPEELSILQGYSKIIALFKATDELKDNLLKLNIPFICNSFIPPDNFKKHIHEHLSKIFGFIPTTAFVRESKGASQKNNIITIHPGSGNVLKNWWLENYIKLARELKKMGERIIFLLGPAESNMVDLLQKAGEKIFCSETFSDIYKLLLTTKLYIGNDSGITHLSAITGIKTVAIFGPTDHLLWSPIGKKVWVITKNKQSSSGIYESVPKIPSCHPCILRGNSIECRDNQRCMPEYEEVYNIVRRILSEKK